MVDWHLHYMTSVMILTLQSSAFLFYVVIYHFHMLVVTISPSWFDIIYWFCVSELFKARSTTEKKLILQGYNESRLESSFCKFYGRYNDLVCDCKLSLTHIHVCWVICFIPFVRLSFPYCLIPYGECDQSAEDVYSFMAPDPACWKIARATQNK
jgi:hypothetical protein